MHLPYRWPRPPAPAPRCPAVTTQRSPTKKQLLKEAEEMLEAGRSPLRDSMIMRQ